MHYSAIKPCDIANGEGAFGRLFLSVAVARVVSVVFNYCCNRYFVFGEAHGSRGFNFRAFGKYAILAVFILTASYVLTGFFHELFPKVALTWVKACVDLMLFLMSYGVQRLVIFHHAGG